MSSRTGERRRWRFTASPEAVTLGFALLLIGAALIVFLIVPAIDGLISNPFSETATAIGGGS
jgi:hypothetical protein